MKLAEAQAAYDAAVAQANAEAAQLLAEAREQAAQIVAEASAAARARAEEITSRAQESLEAERLQAVKSLQAEIAAIAVGQAEQAVVSSLADDARQRRVIDRFLTELESGRIASGDAAATGGRPV
jgi:F0F1-type ATP synthase membrane subunit b/b'